MRVSDPDERFPQRSFITPPFLTDDSRTDTPAAITAAEVSSPRWTVCRNATGVVCVSSLPFTGGSARVGLGSRHSFQARQQASRIQSRPRRRSWRAPPQLTSFISRRWTARAESSLVPPACVSVLTKDQMAQRCLRPVGETRVVSGRVAKNHDLPISSGPD